MGRCRRAGSGSRQGGEAGRGRGARGAEPGGGRAGGGAPLRPAGGRSPRCPRPARASAPPLQHCPLGARAGRPPAGEGPRGAGRALTDGRAGLWRGAGGARGPAKVRAARGSCGPPESPAPAGCGARAAAAALRSSPRLRARDSGLSREKCRLPPEGVACRGQCAGDRACRASGADPQSWRNPVLISLFASFQFGASVGEV